MLEALSTAATVGTFIVIAATAVAAIVQLRHLRAQNELTGLRMPDPSYRASVVDGTFDRSDNPWLDLANSVVEAWETIEELVPLTRHRNGPAVWENFEFLVVRARKWLEEHKEGSYPQHAPRLDIKSKWPLP